jgi:hypothetical protein
MNPSRDLWVLRSVLLILITQWLALNSTELKMRSKLRSLRQKLPTILSILWISMLIRLPMVFVSKLLPLVLSKHFLSSLRQVKSQLLQLILDLYTEKIF